MKDSSSSSSIVLAESTYLFCGGADVVLPLLSCANTAP
jgi:hypothetical protein